MRKSPYIQMNEQKVKVEYKGVKNFCSACSFLYANSI